MADTYDSLLGVNRTTSAQTSTVNTSTQKRSWIRSPLKLLTMQLSLSGSVQTGGQRPDAFPDDLDVPTSQGISSLSTQMESLNSLMTSSQALQASALVGQNIFPDPVQHGLRGGGHPHRGHRHRRWRQQHQGDGEGRERPGHPPEFAIEGSHKGNVAFEWDGRTSPATEAKSGKYSIEAHATVDGKSESIPP